MRNVLIRLAAAFGVGTVASFTLLTVLFSDVGRDDGASENAWMVLPREESPVDPESALSQLVGGAEDRARMVEDLARAWSWQDPHAAMAHADALPEEWRATFISGVTREWAMTDPNGFLAYAESQARIDHLRDGLATALIVTPQQVLDLAARYPSVRISAKRTLEEAAVAAVTENDPGSALAYLETLSPGDRYTTIRGVIAESWALASPEEALAWAEALQPPAPGVVATVIAHTAMTSVEAALNLLESFDAPRRDHPTALAGIATPQAIASTIVRQIATGSDRVRIANTLMHRRTPRALIALEALLAHWVELDAAAAVDWVVSEAERLPPSLPATLAPSLVATDPQAAVALAGSLSMDRRVLLAREIAPAWARRDPLAAGSWLEQFHEHAEFHQLLHIALVAAVGSSPESAVAMLAGSPSANSLRAPGTDVAIRLEGGLAAAWAEQDLPAAAAWVQNISDPEGRLVASRGLVDTWLMVDPRGAQQWVLGLPPGEVKQEAMYWAATNAAIRGYDLDDEFVRATGQEVARQDSLGRLVLIVAQRDAHAAQALVGELIVDNEIRHRTEAQIEDLKSRYSLEPLR